MKITDVKAITLAGPPLPEVAHPAWAPGAEFRHPAPGPIWNESRAIQTARE